MAALLLPRIGAQRVADMIAALRDPDEVMTAEALGRMKSTAFSFTRTLMRRMIAERWTIALARCEIDARGAGSLVYRIDAAGWILTFTVRANPGTGQDRQGRFMETEYDLQGVLYEGEPDPIRDAREHDEQAAKLWGGRSDNVALGWTFANRSNRFFDHVVQRLAAGMQPEATELAGGGGYVVRNAGFYGNGRVGTRSFAAFRAGHALAFPYHVDCFALYLWREASLDVVEATAAARSGTAVRLSSAWRHALGLGNSSGVGMVAAMVRWPHWVETFVLVREAALALIVSSPAASGRVERLARLLRRAVGYYSHLTVDLDRTLIEPFDCLAADLGRVAVWLGTPPSLGQVGGGWAGLIRRTAELSQEAREQVIALIIEVHPEIVDLLEPYIPIGMAGMREVRPAETVAGLRQAIERDYAWALAVDRTQPGAARYFWYRSEENGEQRRGERGIDEGEQFETFIDVAGTVQGLHRALAVADPAQDVATFLLFNPDLRYIVSRVQFLANRPYAEIRSNLIHESFLPLHVIRFLLTAIGIESTHPHSTRWVRGVLMQGAPTPAEIGAGLGGDWILPGSLPEAEN